MKVRYTVPSSASRVDYLTNGSTTVFSVPFVFFDDTDLQVILVNNTSGSESTLALTTSYTVTGGDGAAGSITTTSTYASGYTLVIQREVPYTQEIDYEPNDGFPADVNEEGLDRATMQTQQALRRARQSPKLPTTYDPDSDGDITLPVPVNGKYLIGNAGGTGWLNTTAPGSDASDDTYTPTWAGSSPRVLRYRFMDRMNLTDFGITANFDSGNYTDITTALENALDAIANYNTGNDEQGPPLDLPPGYYKCGQLDTDTGLRSVRIKGAGRFATTIRAKDAQQDHIIRFVNTSSRVNWSETQIKGWLTTASPTDFPMDGIVVEGGTNDFHEMEFNRCRSGLWIKRGNRNRIWKTHFGFFNLYGVKLGGVDNGTPLNDTLTGQSWSGNVATYTYPNHDLEVGDVFTIAGSSPSGYNRSNAVITAVTTNTFSCAELVNPGASTVLGTVTASVSDGAAISETRIHESTFYSGASSQGLGSYAGAQIGLLTDCGATQVENCDGGSTLIGIEVVDNLNLGDQRGTGFITLQDYTSGVNQDCGFWIKNNGGSAEARHCNFSADGVSSGDGVRVASDRAAPSFLACDWHRCARDAIRITKGVAVIVENPRIYQIGEAGTPGTGIHCVSGATKVTVIGGTIDPTLLNDTTIQMNYAVRKASGFTGTVKVVGVTALNMQVKNFSDQDPTEGSFQLFEAKRSDYITIGDDDFVVIPMNTPAGTMLAVQFEGNPSATVPSFIAAVRSNASTAPVYMCSVDATNLVATTGVLNGTTGTDGRFTISSNGTNFYMENRLGASRALSWTQIAG
jgi:hypothetical protein